MYSHLEWSPGCYLVCPQSASGVWEQSATSSRVTAEKWACYLAALSFQSARPEQATYIGSTLDLTLT